MKPFPLAPLVLLLLSIPASASTWFVAPNGNDSAPGTRDAPWATLHHAAERARAGDTVVVRDGAYPVTRPIRPLHSGRPDAWIVYMGLPGEKPTIAAGGMTPESIGDVATFRRSGAFLLENVAYIRLENLTVINSRNVGIMVRGPGVHHIDIVGCRTDRTYGSGIALWYADSSRVVHSEITRANDPTMRAESEPVRSEPPHEGLTVAGATNFEIAYNHIHLS